MAQQSKVNKGKTVPAYSADSMALRYVCGLILVALGVLIFLSVAVDMAGDVFAGARLVCYGMAGGLAFLLPVFPVWGGVVVIVSAQRKPPVRSLILSSVLYLIMLTIANLISITGSPTVPLMTYILELNKTRLTSPDTFEAYLARAYDLGSRTGMGGGLLGMLLAWPLWKMIGVIPAAIVSFLLAGIDLPFLLRLDLPKLIEKIKARSDARRQQADQEQQRLAQQNLLWQQQMAARNAAMAAQNAQAAPPPMPQQGWTPAQAPVQEDWQGYSPVPAQPQLPAPAYAPPLRGTTCVRPVSSTPSPNENGVVVGFQPDENEQYAVATNDMYQEQIDYGRPDGRQRGSEEPSKPRKSWIFGGRKVPAPAQDDPAPTPDDGPVPQEDSTAPYQRPRPLTPAPTSAADIPPETRGPARAVHQDPAVWEDDTSARSASWRGEEDWQADAAWKPAHPAQDEDETPITRKLHAMRSAAEIPLPQEAALVSAAVSAAVSAPVPVSAPAPSAADTPPWEEAPAPESVWPTVRENDRRVKELRDAASGKPATSSAVRVPVLQQEGPKDGWEPELHLPPRKEKTPEQVEMALPPPYVYPGMALLKTPEAPTGFSEEEDALRSRRLEETLQSFKIPAKVRHVTHGPAISRFELEIAAGIRVNKVTELDRNIAMNMEVKSVRIEAPIPGKSLVGVEVPNRKVTPVTLREVLETDAMRAMKSPLGVALGKDIAGQPIVCDLARMPHLLIAGATGSGKSVCVNAMINSILFRCSPKEVRLILIDPKVVELQCYNGIPHLLIPVVSDPHKAAGALEWAVAEMMERYKKFQLKGVREISGYNAKLNEDEEFMPRIVIIIDELADLMMTCRKDVEDRICRIAQLARAAGLHLVVATQRPSVDVITGLIKANIPSRIAFKVSSFIDSRTILDRPGADKLLGYGDMLYLPNGEFTPLRVQGCFLTDAEVNRITDFIRQNSQPDYDPDVLEQLENAEKEESMSADTVEAESDPNSDASLLMQAIEMTVQDGQTSTSMLQRRLRVGFSRAGRLVDEMEKRGVVSAKDGTKPRMCLISREELEQMKQSGALDE